MKKTEEKGQGMTLSRKIISAVLIVLCLVLVAASVSGYMLRGTEAVESTLNDMRNSAVLHIVSDGLVDYEASQAYSAYYWKYRSAEYKKDPLYFRNMGQGQFEENCNAEYARAESEARQKYGTINMADIDVTALEASMNAYEVSYRPVGEQKQKELEQYTDIYTAFVKTVQQNSVTATVNGQEVSTAWIAFVCGSDNVIEDLGAFAAENGSKDDPTREIAMDDASLREAIAAIVPEYAGREDQLNAFGMMARRMAAGEVALALKAAQTEAAEVEEIAGEEDTAIVVSNVYYIESDELKAMEAEADKAFEQLWE